ncbi:MAG: hypothetical protein HC788_11100 [Sphingopyxis sp.]|nr:hypothetical protein [Sphingopyxis sp.]
MSSGSILGRIDPGGLLVSADPALLRLQERAGGRLGGPLMLPQLARLAALSMRLERDITRSMVAADDHSDISAVVSIVPDDAGVSLTIRDWRSEAAQHEPVFVDPAARAPVDAAEPGAWRWECDQQLRLVLLQPTDTAPLAMEWQGRSVSEVFELEPDAEGRFALLIGLGDNRNFDGQRVRLAATSGREPTVMQMAGTALLDIGGGFRDFAAG